MVMCFHSTKFHEYLTSYPGKFRQVIYENDATVEILYLLNKKSESVTLTNAKQSGARGNVKKSFSCIKRYLQTKNRDVDHGWCKFSLALGLALCAMIPVKEYFHKNNLFNNLSGRCPFLWWTSSPDTSGVM